MRLLAKLVQNHAVNILVVSFFIIVFGAYYGSGVFSQLKTDESGLNVEGSQSQSAHQDIKRTFGGDANQVIVTAKNSEYLVTDEYFKKTFFTTLEYLEKHGATITSYYNTGAKELVSKDRKATYAIAEFSHKSDDEVYRLVDAYAPPETESNINIHFGGELITNKQISHQIEKDLSRAEIISLPILLVLLIIIFRSVTAALLPVLLGIIAIIGGMSVVRAIATFVDIDQYSINVITVLGLGLAIDYSLLMVSRFREELADHSSSEAIARTIHSSGRTILFSGLTVMICLLGLTLFPVSFLRSVGIGGVAALTIALVAALTVLPSLLYLLGKNINRAAIGRRQISEQTKSQARLWQKIANTVLQYPYRGIALAVLLIVIAALPLVHLQLKSAGFDFRSLPIGSSSREVAKSLDQDFHNKTPALQVMYTHDSDITSPAALEELYDLSAYLKSLAGVERVEGLISSEQTNLQTYQQLYQLPVRPAQIQQLESQYLSGNKTYFKVYTKNSPTDPSVQQLIPKLRAKSFEHAHISVDGVAAIEYDIREVVATRGPIALVLVALAMVVLLSLLLRSIVIPLQALLINSFSLLAAFGILVWVFQDGWFTGAGLFTQTGSLDMTILILIFAITLGLSMDYATFYYSRVREEFDHRSTTKQAIIKGLVLTGPVITQAAVLLFVVVIAFASSGIALLQQVGLGIALAVLIDAFIVRIILVPLVMNIIGDKNWYYPKFLKRFSIRHD